MYAKIEEYNRKSRLVDTLLFCHLAGKSDYLELCESANGEGFNVDIDSAGRRESFFLTYGELVALLAVISKDERKMVSANCPECGSELPLIDGCHDEVVCGTCFAGLDVFSSPAIAQQAEMKIPGRNTHIYHCPIDGHRLMELVLGVLSCPKCEREYIPTMRRDERGLSWREE